MAEYSGNSHSDGALVPRPPNYIPYSRSGGRSAARPAPGNGIAASLTPAFLWWTFKQWWAYIVPAGLVAAAITAAIVIITYRPDYRASALVKIEESAPYIAFSRDAAATGGTLRFVETQIELLRSILVIGPVLSRPEVAAMSDFATAQDREGSLQKRLMISRIGQSELYNVSYTSESPQNAANVANAVVEAYLTIQADGERARTQRVVDSLERERAARERVLTQKRQELIKLAGEVTGRDPFGFNSTVNFERANSPISNTYAELTQVEVELNLLKAEIQSYRDAPSSGSHEKSGLLNFEMEKHPAIQESNQAIAALTMQAQEFENATLPAKLKENALYQQIADELNTRKQAIKDLKAKIREDILAEREELQRSTYGERLAILQRDYDRLEGKRKLLADKFAAELVDVKSRGSRTAELQLAHAELDREEKVFELIASRKLALQTESQAPARVAVMQAASAPLQPVNALPYNILALACSAALVAPLGLAVLRELSIRRINDVEQVSRETALRVLGEVSNFPIRRVVANPQLLPTRMRRQMFLYLESIDSLRTNIALSESGAGKQLLLVTSGAAGEGKTCLSASLAMSMARASKEPTLIIDADMRSPDVARVLDVKERPGLAELLAKEVTLTEVVQRVGKTNAYVIAAGKLKGNPHHLIREERLKPILEQLREQFPQIIIDTPPIFGGSESLVMAKLADGVILSVLNDKSRLRQLKTAQDRLDRAGANVLGVVMNGCSAGSYAYSYGYGYYSGRLGTVET